MGVGRVVVIVGVLIAAAACTDDGELERLRAENRRLQGEVEELASDVHGLEEELGTVTTELGRTRACLLESRLTLAELARSVNDLSDPEALFFTGGNFRQQFCDGVLKPGVLRALTRQLTVADKFFSNASDARFAELFDRGTTTPRSSGGGGCNPNYSGCLKASASDYDCVGGSGDGPFYTGTVEVIGVDEYDLDADGDGIGCN